MVRIFRVPDTRNLLGDAADASRSGYRNLQQSALRPAPARNDELEMHARPVDRERQVQLPRVGSSSSSVSIAPSPPPPMPPMPPSPVATNYIPLPVAVPLPAPERPRSGDSRTVQMLASTVRDATKEQTRLAATVVQMQADMQAHARMQESVLREEGQMRRSLHDHYQQLSLVVNGLREQMGQLGTQLQADRDANFRQLEQVGQDVHETRHSTHIVRSEVDRCEQDALRECARVETRVERGVGALARELAALRGELQDVRELQERHRAEAAETVAQLRRDKDAQNAQMVSALSAVREQLLVSDARSREQLQALAAALSEQAQAQQNALAQSTHLLSDAVQASQADARTQLQRLEQITAHDFAALHAKVAEVVAHVGELRAADQAINDQVGALRVHVDQSAGSAAAETARVEHGCIQAVDQLRAKQKELSRHLVDGLTAVQGNLRTLQDEGNARQMLVERQVESTRAQVLQHAETLKDELKQDIRQSQRPFLVV